MTVTIKLPKGERGQPVAGHYTKVFAHNGSEITGVSHIAIDIRPDEVVQATVDVHLDSNSTLDNVHALLGTETLEQIAKMHGYRLVPIDED